MIITIDGPSGTGKSTVARQVAHRLQFVYFDTGAMYRAMTWLVIKRDIDITDSSAMERCFKEFDYKIVNTGEQKRYFVGDQDVSAEIRSRAVTQKVSAVSAIARVRAFLLELQYSFAKRQNVVFEGRDLGSTVFPNAEVKIFLDADPRVRAERRMKEMLQKNPEDLKGVNSEQMLLEIMRRDEYDSTRAIAPLCCPPDALKIDTTHLSIDQVVAQIVHYCADRLQRGKEP